MTAATFTQAAFRFYEDGTESGATAIANQDTNITRTVTSDSQLHLRIRFQSTNSGNQAATDDYKLQKWIQHPGQSSVASYVDVTTTSAGVKAIASSSLNEGDATTNRLGAGTGSFVAGKCSEDGIIDDLLITANNYTELLYSLVLEVDEVGHGDIIQFRVQRNAATTGITYSVTPQITISKASTGFGALKGTLTGSGVSITNPASATGSVSVAVGDLIFVQINEGTGGTSAGTCTDNNTNAYTDTGAVVTSSNGSLRTYYHRCTSAFTLTQVDIVASASANNFSILAAVFEGTFASSPLDVNVRTGTDATSPVDWPSSGTLAQADELVLGPSAAGTWDVTANQIVVASPQNLIAVQADTQGGAIQVLLSQVVSATTAIAFSMTSTSTPGANGAVQFVHSFKKEVAGAHQGNATLEGAGSVSGAARQNNQATSTLPGTSTASINTISAQQAAARFGGAGDLSVKADKLIFATFAGAGSFSALARLNEAAAATFGGAGTLSVQTYKFVEATLQGAGDLSAYASLNMRAFATLPGDGVASIEGTVPGGGQAHAGEATFGGAGSLSALAQDYKFGEVTFNGAGSLSALITGRLVAFATFGGAGSLSALSAPTNVKDGQATFDGAGSLSANTQHRKVAFATLDGSGTLSALATGRDRALATLDGIGSLSVLAVARIQITARFEGAGQFSVLVTQGNRAAATMSGTGSMSAEGTILAFGTHAGEAAFGGQGAMACNVLLLGPRRATSRRSFSVSGPGLRRNSASPMRRTG